MSAVVIACPGCQAPLSITPEMVGQAIACPACRQVIQLAGSATSPAIPGGAQIGPAPFPQQPTAAPSLQRNAPPGGAGSPSADAVSKYQSKRQSLAPIVIASWGVVAILLVAAGVLMYLLRQRTLADQELAAVAPESPAAAASHDSVPASPPQRDSAPAIDPIIDVRPTPQDVATSNAPSRPAGSPFAQPPATHIGPTQPTVQSAPKVTRSSPTVAVQPPQPAPAPPPPANPLEGLADVWKVPALISTEPERMATLSRSPTEPISLSIVSLAANIPAAGAIFAESDGGQNAWIVKFVADLATGDNPVTLGAIRLEQLDFVFQWAQPPAETVLRRELANCLVEVRHGNAVKAAQFRQPLKAEPWMIDLEDGVQTAEFPLVHLPKADTLRLEIRELVSFPRDASLRNDQRSIGPGQRAVIEFSDVPGAEMSVQLVKLATSGLVVRTQSEFKENSASKFELSRSRLDALEEAVSKALDKSKRELPGEQARLEAIQRELSSAQSSRPSNLQQQNARNLLIADLAGKVKRSANKVKSLQENIVESEARLTAVPKIRAFLDSLHQKAQLKYVVCAKCGERELVLVDGLQNVSGAE